MLNIYFDERWPSGTGIGVVSQQLRSRLNGNWNLAPLQVAGKHAGILAPLKMAAKLKEKKVLKTDVFWNPGFVPPASVVCRTVVEVHDLTHLHYYSRLHRFYYNNFYRPLYRKVDKIVTCSEYTKFELCEWAGLSSDKVDVIYNGVSAGFSPVGEVFSTEYDYIFYPGNYRPYKNLKRLMSAFSLSRLPKLGVFLLMTGAGDKDLYALARSLNIEDRIRFTGRLSVEELAACYRTSKMVCFPSLYEGFGLPIIEGMASGVPVLTSNLTSMPEVSGGAAYLVDPISIEEIRDGMNSLFFDNELRGKLIKRGLERAKEFSWDHAAEKMSAIFSGFDRNE